MIDEKRQFEDAGKVQTECDDSSEVEGPYSAAVVGKTASMVMSHWVSFDLNSRESDVKDSLDNNPHPVEHPSTQSRCSSLPININQRGVRGYLCDMSNHSIGKCEPRFRYLFELQMSPVKRRTNPKIIHQHRKQNHHCGSPKRPSKLKMARLIHFMRWFPLDFCCLTCTLPRHLPRRSRLSFHSRPIH